MKKGFLLFVTALFLGTMGGEVFAQSKTEPARAFNRLYEPLPVVMRLSYENFKNIKLLNAAILNYGGGEGEFDRLVEDYAEASSLYFRNEFVASANKFTENEKNIQESATKIAGKYREATEKLQKDVIKMKIKASMKMALANNAKMSVHPAAEKAIMDGGYALSQANDFLARSRPMTAIYYYRRAKESFFVVYNVLEKQYKDQSEVATGMRKENDARYYTQEAKKYSLPAEYQRDIADNRNRVFEKSNREKEN